MKMLYTSVFFLCFVNVVFAQTDRWQQAVSYKMNITVDEVKNQFKGEQQLMFTNNSPDTLKELFFHLYLNAFQPNSSMDVRSRVLGKTTIKATGRQDWDERVKDRIQNLQPDEIGYQKIQNIEVAGIAETVEYYGTVARIKLSKPILPKSKTTINMDYEAQIPLQIRRTGRDNPKNKVRYSMAQWYPKLCNYDQEGWHPTPYIAREFYGIFGDFDVTININKDYKLGATGELQNAKEIGWGYDAPNTALKPINSALRRWNFVAKNVHDFMWAADPGYAHFSEDVDGVRLHYIYKNLDKSTATDTSWKFLALNMRKALPLINKTFGRYPYTTYSFIQGGDGGMEYPMATLINSASVGTAVHELMHSWYQGVLGFNESLHGWMDEGFTSYTEDIVMEDLNGKTSFDIIQQKRGNNDLTSEEKFYDAMIPHQQADSYLGYYKLVFSGLEEPLTTHADHYKTNYAYSNAVYNKGAVFLNQLGYVIGKEKLAETLKKFYDVWKFKHPNANDFIRVAENVSGLQLQWYKEYFVNSTKYIRYQIDSVNQDTRFTNIYLSNTGEMPMPLDVKVEMKDGTTTIYNIPLNLMFGNKEKEFAGANFKVLKSWDWTSPTYVIQLQENISNIKKVEIDDTKRIAIVDRREAAWPR